MYLAILYALGSLALGVIEYVEERAIMGSTRRGAWLRAALVAIAWPALRAYQAWTDWWGWRNR